MSDVARGRAAFEKESWTEAYTQLKRADADAPLGPDDLDRLATAAFLIGDEAGSIDAWTRAHAASLDHGDLLRAASSALWLAFTGFDRPNWQAQAAGWLARARRAIEEAQQSCPEQGWLICAAAHQHIRQGEFAAAHATFAEAADVGRRFRNRDLVALARHGEGRSLLRMERMAEGFALLDEVMLSVTGGEVGPIATGVIYCSVISACDELFDLRRALEWTAALQRWLTAHPDVVPFRGHCLVRRSEMMQLGGQWPNAIDEASRACALLAPGQPASGAARYQLAELHRLRGEFDRAEEAYRQASQAGRKPHPGLALLRLAQGQADAADAAIRSALQEARDVRGRVPVLQAAVEISLAREDLAAGRAAASELASLAATLNAPALQARSSHAIGAVLLADRQTEAALQALREACSVWQELDAPYEHARVRVGIGLAYRQLGDQEGAQLEFEAAHEIFDRLGAAPDVARVQALVSPAPVSSGGLTGREVEVLRLIATGASNRTIGSRLKISEKTVARHVSNIFVKLDLPSRAAATAYAYRHKLV